MSNFFTENMTGIFVSACLIMELLVLWMMSRQIANSYKKLFIFLIGFRIKTLIAIQEDEKNEKSSASLMPENKQEVDVPC